MRSLILCAFVICFVAVGSSNIPLGFQPIPPLPGQNFFGTSKTQTPKPKVTPKPTQKPAQTKKPVVTKAPVKPPVTAAPLPPTTQKPQTAAPSNCNTNINIPQANCVGGNSAVQQTLNTLKQQLDKTRQQHQAQNSAVQSMITKLQGQQAGYLTRISDLQNEVRNLIYAFNALNNQQPSSTTVSPAGPTTPQSGSTASVPSAALVQAIQSVRHDMGQTVNDFNGKLLNLTLQVQSNQLQDSKLHQSVESQIQGQAKDIGRLSQQVTDLNRILQQLLNSTSGSGSSTGSGATSADVTKLRSEIQQVAADLKTYDTKQQTQVSSLNQKTAALQSTVTGHTSDINNLKTGASLTSSRINIVQRNVTVVRDALVQFRQAITPKMSKITGDIASLTSKSTKLESDNKALGNSVIGLATSISKATSTLKGLEAQTTSLKNETASLQKSVTDQGKELLNIKLGMVTMKNLVPDLQSMNNVILTVISKGGSPTTTQLQDISDAIKKIENKLNQLLNNPFSG